MLVRRPSGEFTEHTLDGRLTREGQTLQCVHCGLTWVIEPGSGRQRGFCFRCSGPTCGSGPCRDCLPFEQRLVEIEQRLALWRSMERSSV